MANAVDDAESRSGWDLIVVCRLDCCFLVLMHPERRFFCALVCISQRALKASQTIIEPESFRKIVNVFSMFRVL